MIWIKDGDVIWKNELLNSKADESNENIYTNMNNDGCWLGYFVADDDLEEIE